jgi:hypothetical protein
MDKKLSKNAKIAIGAGAIAAGGLLAWYFLSANKGPSKSYTDEQLIRVARELKRELFPAWHIVFDMSRKLRMMIAAQLQTNPNNLPPQYQDIIFQKAVAESNL